MVSKQTSDFVCACVRVVRALPDTWPWGKQGLGDLNYAAFYQTDFSLKSNYRLRCGSCELHNPSVNLQVESRYVQHDMPLIRNDNLKCALIAFQKQIRKKRLQSLHMIWMGHSLVITVAPVQAISAVRVKIDLPLEYWDVKSTVELNFEQTRHEKWRWCFSAPSLSNVWVSVDSQTCRDVS